MRRNLPTLIFSVKELTYAERGGAGASPAGAYKPMLPGRVCETGASEAT